MNVIRFNHIVATIAATSGLLLGAGAAHGSRGPTSQVASVAAEPANLSDICPGAEAALKEELAGTAAAVGVAATVNVKMAVDGRRISRITTSGAVPEYRRAARHAAMRLSCSSESARAIAFSLDFRPTQVAAAGTSK